MTKPESLSAQKFEGAVPLNSSSAMLGGHFIELTSRARNSVYLRPQPPVLTLRGKHQRRPSSEKHSSSSSKPRPFAALSCTSNLRDPSQDVVEPEEIDELPPKLSKQLIKILETLRLNTETVRNNKDESNKSTENMTSNQSSSDPPSTMNPEVRGRAPVQRPRITWSLGYRPLGIRPKNRAAYQLHPLTRRRKPRPTKKERRQYAALVMDPKELDRVEAWQELIGKLIEQKDAEVAQVREMAWPVIQKWQTKEERLDSLVGASDDERDKLAKDVKRSRHNLHVCLNKRMHRLRDRRELEKDLAVLQNKHVISYTRWEIPRRVKNILHVDMLAGKPTNPLEELD